MKIAVVLTAFDKMSSVINNATDNAEKKLTKLMAGKFLEGGAMMATGVGILRGLSPAIGAYSRLETANVDLQASMMDSTGAIDKNFTKVASLAESLGDKLPGATKDFDQMFEVMMNNGVKATSVLDGVGKAAAYLAVDLKMPYDAAGQFAARMKEATGVADSEMLGFMDTISRANALGIQASEMQYAFSRSAGSLKLLGLQGLQASKDVTVLYASLIRAGMSGETAATSFNNLIQNVLDKKKFAKFSELAKANGIAFQFFDKEGKFLGVENMVSQFDKMKGLSTTKRAELVQALTGGGADGQALNNIITQGAAGYAKMRSEMEKKAALNDKVNIKLKTLASIWEATTGTIENMLAALGAGLAPILKPIGEMIGTVAGNIKVWLSNNPAMAKFISMVVALVGVFFTLLGAVKIIQGIRIAMQLLNLTLAANPFILLASVAILAISLIYANWGKIKAWFSKLWASVKQIFVSVWTGIKTYLLYFTPVGLIYKYWDKIVGFFSGLWGRVRGVFLGMVRWVGSLGQMFFNAGRNIVKSIGEGIKSLAMWPINKIKEMVGKIRNLLPFSPAKDGPLRDIHRIRLVETIAESIKPASLINKMKNVAKLTFDVMNGRPGGAKPLPGAGGANAGGSVNVTFNVSLSGTATKQDAKTLLSEVEKRFPMLIKQYQAQQSRLSI